MLMGKIEDMQEGGVSNLLRGGNEMRFCWEVGDGERPTTYLGRQGIKRNWLVILCFIENILFRG